MIVVDEFFDLNMSTWDGRNDIEFIYLFILTFFIDLVCNCRQQQWLWFLLGAPGSWAISPLQPTF
jgi:uncharacterized membrane protein YjjB (DUF3815 family)